MNTKGKPKLITPPEGATSAATILEAQTIESIRRGGPEGVQDIANIISIDLENTGSLQDIAETDHNTPAISIPPIATPYNVDDIGSLGGSIWQSIENRDRNIGEPD